VTVFGPGDTKVGTSTRTTDSRPVHFAHLTVVDSGNRVASRLRGNNSSPRKSFGAHVVHVGMGMNHGPRQPPIPSPRVSCRLPTIVWERPDLDGVQPHQPPLGGSREPSHGAWASD